MRHSLLKESSCSCPSAHGHPETTKCHSEPFAVILSAAKDLALGAQGKLREESRSASGRLNQKDQSEIPRFARNDSAFQGRLGGFAGGA
jgi:hypothetical protein